MKTKALIVIQSHLSDALIENKISGMESQVQLRLKFVKYLIQKYLSSDIDIDPEEEFEMFQKWILELKTYLRKK